MYLPVCFCFSLLCIITLAKLPNQDTSVPSNHVKDGIKGDSLKPRIKPTNGNCSSSVNDKSYLEAFLDGLEYGDDQNSDAEDNWIDALPRAPRPCPCSNASLCDPIVHRPTQEVFIMSLRKNWRLYDWNKITTIVEFTYIDDELLCFAHARGVRVVIKSNYKKKYLLNATMRAEWANDLVDVITSNFVDGVNIDFEGALTKNDSEYRLALNDLLRGLADKMRAKNPYAQLTTDIEYQPGHNVRHYDYVTIANITDFMFIMDYGTKIPHSTVWANAAFNITLMSIRQYLALGVPREKLLLGVPWSGKIWPCSKFDEASQRCKVTRQHTGKHRRIKYNVNYYKIMKMLSISCSGRLWDSVAQSPFADFKHPDNVMYQLWYDDPESLALKYAMARNLNLRGVGVWYADAISYKDPDQVAGMWGALP